MANSLLGAVGHAQRQILLRKKAFYEQGYIQPFCQKLSVVEPKSRQ